MANREDVSHSRTLAIRNIAFFEISEEHCLQDAGGGKVFIHGILYFPIIAYLSRLCCAIDKAVDGSGVKTRNLASGLVFSFSWQIDVQSFLLRTMLIDPYLWLQM